MVDQEPKYNGKYEPADETGDVIEVSEEQKGELGGVLTKAVRRMIGRLIESDPGAIPLVEPKKQDWSKSTNWTPGKNAPSGEDKT